MTRRITAEALALIKRWEGKRNEAYRDSAGVWTIGFGRTAGVRPGQFITDAEADAYLLEDLGAAERAVERLVKVPLSDGQFGALVSFVFNLGEGSFAASSLLRKLNARNYDAVPAELMRWTKAANPATGRKETLPGLVNRRAAEAGLWARGAVVASNTVEPAAPTATPTAKTAATAGGALGAIAAAAVAASPFAGVLERLAEGAPYLVAASIVIVAGVASWVLLRREVA